MDAQALVRAVLNDGAGAVGLSVAGSVLIECSRAGRPSMAMIGARVMMLRRELSPPVFAAVARRLRISAQIIFFQRKVGVRSGKGRGLDGKRSVFATPEKKRYIDFGAWVGYYVG